MSCPNQAVPTPAEIVAAAPADRLALIRAFTAPLFAAAEREDAERLAAGICRERECTSPACHVEPLPYLCAEHARQFELEALIEDQEDDDE